MTSHLFFLISMSIIFLHHLHHSIRKAHRGMLEGGDRLGKGEGIMGGL